MKLIIAIDGACRRNGQADCVSAGGIFIQSLFDDDSLAGFQCQSEYEFKSTNQRGEMLALLGALTHIYQAKSEAQIITDSEYLFNAMTKEWPQRWSKEGWVGSTGSKVKNADIWQQILHVYNVCVDYGLELTFYHVKGHTMPFGKVTAQRLLEQDETGEALFKAITTKFNEVKESKQIEETVRECSIKNNGFAPAGEILERFVVFNMVSDAIATRCVEAADRLWRAAPADTNTAQEGLSPAT